MHSPDASIRAIRRAARTDRRFTVPMKDTGARDLFGAPILAPAEPAKPADPAAWVETISEEEAFLIDHAPTARLDELPPVYFRPSLFPLDGQRDFFN